MKIFDFSNGKKGDLLTSIRIPNGMQGFLDDAGKRIPSVDRYEFCISGDDGINGDYVFNARTLKKDFSVSAICFCTGQVGDAWQWFYCATPEWLAEYHKKKFVFNEV